MEERRESKKLKLASGLCWPTVFSEGFDHWVPSEGLLDLETGTEQ